MLSHSKIIILRQLQGNILEVVGVEEEEVVEEKNEVIVVEEVVEGDLEEEDNICFSL